MVTGISQFLKSRAIAQYLGIPAQGAAMLGDKVVVAISDGLCFLDDPEDDDGYQIQAWFKTIKTDFNEQARKRIRSLYFRGKARRLQVGLITEDRTLDMEYNSSSGGLRHEEGFLRGQRSQVGAYWQLEVSNLDGDDFSVDAMDVIVITQTPNKGRR